MIQKIQRRGTAPRGSRIADWFAYRCRTQVQTKPDEPAERRGGRAASLKRSSSNTKGPQGKPWPASKVSPLAEVRSKRNAD
jgi:hypothetical protein